ncbi:NUDIX domain-containing protein [Phenylobacterium sp.]|uniref:NUDIX domain-containing protein n=1 Tax=Phenylobacterium sp. TaxID=1871053 RepID=UPI002C1447FC|nr:NUDIX domain-containing protein [Phenylobacterium sp.]HVI31362.1 NUDIX domain-containing protein [Phenylobacterium sp.]
MPEVSAGVLAWRPSPDGPQVLLVHPGGPYWRGKDKAAWSIPKGLAAPGEDLYAAALREFAEELGQPVSGEAQALAPCRTPGGKWIHAWLVQADLDLTGLRSNVFEIEWPPRSGRRATFPEVDQAAYLAPDEARVRIHAGQRPVLEDALRRLGWPP